MFSLVFLGTPVTCSQGVNVFTVLSFYILEIDACFQSKLPPKGMLQIIDFFASLNVENSGNIFDSDVSNCKQITLNVQPCTN